ncbi:MAG: 16S rRNA (cytosine(967)-C(5))-methyltransferase RsmB [Solirubrobacteraceae bacterium]
MSPQAAIAEVTAARACAYTVVRRVFEHGAYADRAFRAEADRAGLNGRDRAQAMALAYATVQRAGTLDHVVTALCNRPPRRLEPAVLAALRLGLAQLLALDGFAQHAAVDESVTLAKRDAPAAAGLVNAVLRRATREGRALLDALDDLTPEAAAVRHSVPEWLALLWWRELGADRARSLLATVNDPPESALRVNTLVADVDDVAAGLGVRSHAAAELPEGLVLDGPFDVHGSEEWARGEVMAHSRASMLVARTLAPQAGERILDLCAAPGAKTTHLAALAGDGARLTAIERHPGRARTLEATLERMHVRAAQVEVRDAAVPAAGAAAEAYERILVDPPCSGLGTLQSRPDLRWRARPERIPELAAQQHRILEAAADAAAGTATLVYSVCTISAAESDGVVERFLEARPDWSLEQVRRPAPDVDGTDGFYIARLRRG